MANSKTSGSRDTILKKETQHFELEFIHNSRKERFEFKVRSRQGGKNWAIHTRYNLMGEDGFPTESSLIDENVARYIAENFERKGDTESFNLYPSEVKNGGQVIRREKVTPDSVRHVKTLAENSFTATGVKLNWHEPIFRKWGDTGFGSIIRATLTNHQVCSSHCQFCSTILRNRQDSVTLAEAKEFIEKLYFDQAEYNKKNFPEYNEAYRELTGTDIRLKGLILSGGGQPNLWPHFEEFVTWLQTLEIDLGLITNGFPKKVDEEVYRAFKWIRISVTPEDASPHYVNGRFDRQYIPQTILHNPDIKMGLSYVYGPWSEDKILVRLRDALETFGFDYCRVLTDCNLTRNSQLQAHRELGERLFRLGLVDEKGSPTSGIFHQLKYHGTREEAGDLWNDGQCFLQTYNVFWDTTGHEKDGYSHCYPCDSITVLAEEMSDGNISVSDRKFNAAKWGTVPNTQVERLFTEKVTPTFDPRKICTSCLFMKNNETVKKLAARKKGDLLDLPEDVEHVNFP